MIFGVVQKDCDFFATAGITIKSSERAIKSNRHKNAIQFHRLMPGFHALKPHAVAAR
jgi:hypothetical protein